MTATEPTSEELAEAAAELVRLWHTRAEINPDRHLDRYHDARLHTVSGLAAHAYRTGEVADRLIREGLWLESAPLIRTSYECAITAQWTALVPDGAEAILNEDYRSRRTMAATLKRSQFWAASGLRVPDPSDEGHASYSNAQARNFEQMCDDLEPGGSEAYTYYRTLCWFSHPTNYVIDRYTEKEMPPLKLRRTPRGDDETSHTLQYFGVSALVVAAAALNHLDADSAHGAAIAQVAARVAVAAEMRLTSKALARVNATP
ncbi:DUF5677 domain-containing protein [Nocardioides sp. ChNu-99]|uniref:DUF5677 domain-containing protein n=1 Tax=Nocardioides sp. ChNu-99 TaxID=2839897 RepID=UPI002405DBAC|nr:DUF5677 domain-containing protein [Nocardioides sp. ChNu-99]MDF9716479.1 hypothetical protein [Nocardioides sp. ChNu-99]